jgi:hypothetical protein
MGEKMGLGEEEIKRVEKEKNLEGHPSEEQVRSKVLEFVEGRQYTEGRTLKDENGVYLFEIITVRDDEGYSLEYSYSRKGPQPKDRCPVATVVHVTNYKDDFPIDGESVAKFIYEKGEWENHPKWVFPPPFIIGESRIGVD